MFGQNKIVGRKYFREHAGNDKLFVTSIFHSLQGEGPLAGRPAVFLRLARCNLSCGFCFVGNTLVTVPHGKQKKIKDVKVGDAVVAYNERTNQFKESTVTRTYVSEVDDIVCVRTGPDGSSNASDRVYCTPEHPFLVKGKGWVQAQHLQRDDVLIHFSESARMQLSNPQAIPHVRERLTALLRTPRRRAAASAKMRETTSKPGWRKVVLDRMKNRNPMKDPAIALKSHLSRRDLGKKTLAEQRFERIVGGLPVKFVGDGSLVVGFKVPDFAVVGQKKVIEVWDSSALHHAQRGTQWRKQRASLFAKHGYKTLFIPLPSAGIRNGVFDKVRQRVAEFINNGSTVRSVKRIEKGSKAWVRLAGSLDAECKVYNLEVADTHTYVANGKVVHNCDTFFDNGTWLAFAEVFSTIRTITPWKVDLSTLVLVITGGEPSLQENLVEFINIARTKFATVQIETNGLQYIPLIDTDTALVVSPKCAEVAGLPVSYLKPTNRAMQRANCFKFLLTADRESPYHTVPDWAFAWRRENKTPIYVSPMNEYKTYPDKSDLHQGKLVDRNAAERVSFWQPGLLDLGKVKANHEYAAQYCLEHGTFLTLQMQLFASLP